MRRTIPALFMTVVVPAFLLSVPAWADQKGGGSSAGGQSSAGSSHAGGGASSGGGGGHATSGGGGGGHVSSGGGGHVSGGGGHVAGGSAARGGSETARAGGGNGTTSRGPSGSTATSTRGTAVPRGTAGAATPGSDRAGYRGNQNSRTDPVPPYSRPRDGKPAVGQAVQRPSGGVPPALGGIYYPAGSYGAYYPWAFGGLGLSAYYGGYYNSCFDPFMFGDCGAVGYGSAGYYGGGYGAYGGYGSYGGYDDQQVGTSAPAGGEEGAIHLKVKPSDAQVYVDGYYVGVVDNFDGMFQKLHLEAGAHRVEIRKEGYESLTFDVRVEPDTTTTYRGELKKVQ